MTSSTTTPTVWRANPAVELHWRQWGGDSVVLDAAAAQVYQFDPLASAVMAVIETTPATVDAIATELSSDIALDPDPEFVEAVAGIVEHFRELGWVAPTAVAPFEPDAAGR